MSTDFITLLASQELNHINTTGYARAPLVLHLQDQVTDQEFLFMVNHLYRSKDDERHIQAELLNDWAQAQTLPVIAVGDYNFDWAVSGGCTDHDLGYDNLTADHHFTWIRPAELIHTQCSGWPCQYESVLDFVFAAGPARTWPARAIIATWENDFPDDNTTSDHRPVTAVFRPALAGQRPLVHTRTWSYPAPDIRATPAVTYPDGIPIDPIGRSEDGRWLQLTCNQWLEAAYVANLPASLPIVDAAPNLAITVLKNTGYEEIIGIKNQGEFPVHVGDWYLDGSKGADTCYIPADIWIEPNGTYTIATGKSEPTEFGVKCRHDTIWNNKGETIYLHQPDGTLITERYTSN